MWHVANQAYRYRIFLEKVMSSTISNSSQWGELFKKEDWWSIWIGLGLLLSAILFFSAGSSIGWIAVIPSKWHTLSDLWNQLVKNAPRYLGQFILWITILGFVIQFLKISFKEFFGSFLFIYLISILVFALGQWDKASYYNLEPPLVALALRLDGIETGL